MEICSWQDVGVEIGLAKGGWDMGCEFHAQTAYQYHPPSYSMQYELHGRSERHAEDDGEDGLCKY
jgi:hypothetical protein